MGLALWQPQSVRIDHKNGRGLQEEKNVTRPEGRGLEPWEGALGTAMSVRAWPRCSPEP